MTIATVGNEALKKLNDTRLIAPNNKAVIAMVLYPSLCIVINV
jgi:hypothetical protein